MELNKRVEVLEKEAKVHFLVYSLIPLILFFHAKTEPKPSCDSNSRIGNLFESETKGVVDSFFK